MNLIYKCRKPIAMFMLCVLVTELAIPSAAWALTSGPSQPEMTGFKQAGTSDMVDLFTGDLSYNIPLLDVGGYPVNLSYQAGSGMDDEASWVGLGWSLNPGVVNRQMRGLPDDFNGDVMSKEFSMKDDITAGGNVQIYPELFGLGKKLNLSVNVGIFKNSYRGWGAEIGANAGINLTGAGAASNNTETGSEGSASLSIGLQSNSKEGASIKPSVNLAITKMSKENVETNAGLSIGSGYNSRAGVQSLTLSPSLQQSTMVDVKQVNDKGETVTGKQKRSASVGGSSSISFAKHSYSPQIDIPFNNQSYTFSASFGPAAFAFHLKGGITGYYMKQKLARNSQALKAYGLLHAEKGQQDVHALMDFNRENDIPYQDGVPYLPIPISTADLFSVTSQQGGGQYKLYRNGSGVFFDHRGVNNSFSASLGVEIGAGNIFQGGVDIYAQKVTTKAGKWQDHNDFLGKGQFNAADNAKPLLEPAYFKRVGEPVAIDENYYTGLFGDQPLRVDIRRGKDMRALNTVVTGDGKQATVSQPFKREKRETRNNVFSYLNAQEASQVGLDKTIHSYPKNEAVFAACDPSNKIIKTARTEKPAHHISEIVTTDNGGTRTVFGIPVYNTLQEEATFSVDASKGNTATGMAGYTHLTDDSRNNRSGRDHYASKQSTPPFAYAYLLTGILSPDYVDVTGNGISDDDLGTAVKFNYTKGLSSYGWRTPYKQDSANFNQNMLSDLRDDKANYTYGRKEIWYTHSIESKTMVAVFYTKNREDGLGVTGSNGAKDLTNRQQYLEKIVLYTKSDLIEKGANAIPVKTVHFEYDYSLCANAPNNSGNAVMVEGVDVNARKGKLTLKKVYFTFGGNRKGMLQPYRFHYKDQVNGGVIPYAAKQTDRWGTYKDGASNPGNMRNDEHPYASQDKTKADEYAGLWQLNRIELPSGGNITVALESDDYGYVQNRRAMQMSTVAGFDTKGKADGMMHANELLVNLPQPVSSQEELMFRYFQGIEKLYFKCYTDLDGLGHYEYVPGYGNVKRVRLVDANTAAVTLERVEGVSPMTKTAWQFLRINLPLHAYPGSDTDDLGGDVTQIIRSLAAAVANLKELVEDFDKKAERKKFGNRVELNRSWVRLNAPSFTKLGGGSRVKSIRISDVWQAMSGQDIADGVYGQDYHYTTTTADEKGRQMEISSGVAAYEPMIGNDENPFRQPFSYQNKPSFLGLNNYYYMEDPIGEGYFPAPTVGYSKVTMRHVGADNSTNKTGYILTEFYTAKDFPVIVKKMDKNHQSHKPSPILSLFKVKVANAVGVSQGYSIELNDMHGRQRGESVYNRGGSQISGLEYTYKTENPLAAQQRLQNNVLLLNPDGTIKDGRIAEEVEVFTDMREQYTENIGGSVHASVGAFMAWIFPVPYFYPGIGPNIETRAFRSASTVKVINKFGVLQKVKKIQDGSAISTENVAWDSETGEVLLTRTYNEFNDPVYNLTYPAHWAYGGMGQAYKNIGLEIRGVSTTTNRELVNIPPDLLVPGDEVLNVSNGQKGWISMPPGSGMRLLNAAGASQVLSNATLKVTRSGRRNMAQVPVGAVTSLRNPIKGGRIDVTAFSQVLDVSAATFKEEWQVPLPKENCAGCDAGYILSADGLWCERWDTVPRYRPDSTRVCAAVYPSYGARFTFVYDSGYSIGGLGTGNRIPFTSTFWHNQGQNAFSGPLNRTGVWSCKASEVPYNRWIGFRTSIEVPATKTYYVGMGGDNEIRFKVDDTVIVDLDVTAMGAAHGGGGLPNAFTIWHVYPVTLSAGTHTIEMEGLNYNDTASFGAEIYDNTALEILNSTGYMEDVAGGVDTIFSSRNARGKYFQVGDTTAACRSGFNPLPDGLRCVGIGDRKPAVQQSPLINPYASGILGNWRPWQQFAYHDARKNMPVSPANATPTIRKSGVYNSYTAFWNYSGGIYKAVNSSHYPNWVMKNEVMKYSDKGEGIEEKDALDRYSAAQYGYLGSVPLAVASNARNTEIGFDGFEDYQYTLTCNALVQDECSIEKHFDFRKLMLLGNAPTREAAHTGNFSLKLSAPAVMKRKVTITEGGNLLAYDVNGQASTTGNTSLKQFMPKRGVRYVASVWVKNASINANTTNVLDVLSGTTLIAGSEVAGPRIEGWRKVELVFTVPANATEISFRLNPKGGATYFDDIRVHPYDGFLKGYVYNSSNMFLMAELDENNYATFYEYDDEGTLVRIKKETEKGIMTLKENRLGYKIQ